MPKITLPWPDKALNPNHANTYTGHWAYHSKAKKYRTACGWIAKTVRPSFPPEGDIVLRVTFYPPDKRKRDRINMEASLKSGFDGLADAWGVNDIRFKPIYDLKEPVKNGAVVVEVD